jgi:hypothetical protein
MKNLGFFLLSVGFLGGALAATIDKVKVPWAYFGGAMMLGVVGVILVHRHTRRHTQSETRQAANLQDIMASLGRIVENIIRLNTEKQTINAYDMRHEVNRLFDEDLLVFVGARESLAHAHGLQAYADVMSHFAAGERYLNRVWSASADGYVDEIDAYLEKARDQFVEAMNLVRRTTGAA